MADDDVHVEVWNAFTGRWTVGFTVAEVVDGAYRIRRLSDGAVLPVPLSRDCVRPRHAEAPRPASARTSARTPGSSAGRRRAIAGVSDR
jgi:hypothetical protein